MKEYWKSIVNFLIIYLFFHLFFWLLLLLVGNRNQIYDELFVIWFGGTLILPILFVGYFLRKRGERLDRAFGRMLQIYSGEPYALLLYAVLVGSFGIIFYGGWQLSQYLYHNEIISNTIASIILLCSLILAIPISFYLLVKISDYLDLHGY
jgi:hypothetical protein